MSYTPEEITEILEAYFDSIAHRQYIGARYVPIFGRVGESSCDWDNTGDYEPLTIVLHEGNSYTSRQYVPAGADIGNTDYWVLTGNFNAQVESYRREVANLADIIPDSDFSAASTVKDAIDGISGIIPASSFSSASTVKDAIDAIAGIIPASDFSSASTVKDAIDAISNTAMTELVTIGDSFGDPADQGAENVWTLEIARRLGLTLHNFSKGGAGYVHAAASKTFVTLASSAASDTSFDHDNVKYCLVYGGYNDVANNENKTTFATNVGAVIDTLAASFPKCEIVVFGSNSRCYQPVDIMESQLSPIFEYTKIIHDTCVSKGVQFVNTAEWLWGYYSAFKGDFLHPNSLGKSLIVDNMLAFLHGQKILNTTLSTNIDEKTSAFGLTTYVQNCKFTILKNALIPSRNDVIVEFECGTAHGNGSHTDYSNFLTLSYYRNFPEGLMIPTYHWNTDDSIWEVWGYLTRESNSIVARKYSTSAVAVGEKFRTGPIPFGYTDVEFKHYQVTE